MTAVCKHCGKRIVLVNWALGRGWTHWQAEHSSINQAHEHCHLSVAEPVALTAVDTSPEPFGRAS